jgi:hypothetical protein
VIDGTILKDCVSYFSHSLAQARISNAGKLLGSVLQLLEIKIRKPSGHQRPFVRLIGGGF